MELLNERAWRKTGYTIGRFSVDGARICDSLEDTDRGLVQTWPLATIKALKIAGETAIPTGTYRVVLSYSQKFRNKTWAQKYGGLVPEILDVPGYSGVRIHPGNKAADTLGCILLGENKVVGGLVNSKKKYEELMDKYLVPAWSRKEVITITIR